MEHVLTIAGVLVALFLVLRVSLARRGKSFDLRGGLTALNVLTGLLAGAAAAFLLRDLLPGGPVAPGGAAVEPGVPVPAPLVRALRTILPLWGATLGGIAGYLVFGALWRRLFRGGSASVRAWLLRAQFVACTVAILFLLLR
jgi:hypothetical protein